MALGVSPHQVRRMVVIQGMNRARRSNSRRRTFAGARAPHEGCALRRQFVGSRDDHFCNDLAERRHAARGLSSGETRQPCRPHGRIAIRIADPALSHLPEFYRVALEGSKIQEGDFSNPSTAWIACRKPRLRMKMEF
jgi:hypothetical protein